MSPAPEHAVASEALRVVPMLADLAADELAWIAERSELSVLDAGEVLYSVGEPADWMCLLLDGTMQARREKLGPGAPAFTFHRGDIAGIIPFSRMTEFPRTLRATTAARVARFPKARFDELLQRVPKLEPRFVQHMADRVRDATRQDQQFEKLAALGKLSAGLAHELNNPAAAIGRSAAEARERVRALGALTAALVAAGATPDGLAALDDARGRVASAAGGPLDALARSDREEAVSDWLESLGMDDAWSRAPTLVEAGFDVPTLEAAVAGTPAAARAAALAWLEAAVAADALLGNVMDAALRVSHLVGAIKMHTHMDRPNEQEAVDVHAGLESTLAILGHRVREKRIAVERDYAASLPVLMGFAGALNQVWSNLLENAVAAAPPGGRVTVRTAHADGAVLVEVRDDGPGIPTELRERIFEPFFTTKDVGQGTGLGLDIARRMVVQHDGEIQLTSEPGNTRFLVRLPLRDRT